MPGAARVLGHDEFVARMLAWKARQKAQKARNPRVKAKAAPSAQGREKKPKRTQYVDYSKVNRYRRAVVRDDGVVFPSMTAVMLSFGQAGNCHSRLKKAIEEQTEYHGHTWRFKEEKDV